MTTRRYPNCDGDCGDHGIYCCDGGWDTEPSISARAEEKAARTLHEASGFPSSAWDGAPQGLLKSHVRAVARSLVESGELVPARELAGWEAMGEALSEAAKALGRDRGRRNESVAQRITAIRAERDELRAERDRWYDEAARRNERIAGLLERVDLLRGERDALLDVIAELRADPFNGKLLDALYAKAEVVKRGET